jgi:2-phosphoglycerate kinase
MIHIPKPINKKRLFITGIPTAGKSYLAKKLAEEVGGVCVSVDDVREELAKDQRYKKWVNYYLDQDEYTYYTTTTYAEQWKNLVAQSEGFWPGILTALAQYADEDRPVIFEGVNILPHLAHKDLQIPGIVIIGRSLEETLERNMREPRWGATEELQKLEADAFFNGERPHYKDDAEKYGYPVFETPNEAWATAVQILTSDPST